MPECPSAMKPHALPFAGMRAMTGFFRKGRIGVVLLWALLCLVPDKALADVDSMKWFVVAGFLCYFNFMCWYRGNAMCGAALGMACNGAYSFWGPFFCWLILGVVFGLDGWNMVPVAWVGAVLMVVGIFTIATNPLALFHRKEQ